jgi:hypothetical protein
MDFVFLAEAASVLPNHTHFFPTKTSVLNRHTEERVFVLLVVGGKGVLVEQHQFRVIRTSFREIGKVLSDGGNQAGLSLHAFVSLSDLSARFLTARKLHVAHSKDEN